MTKVIHIIWLVMLNLIIFLPDSNAVTHSTAHHTKHYRTHRYYNGSIRVYK